MKGDELHYYARAWKDLINGSTLPELRRVLHMYANLEEFEACVGIQKAIKEYVYYIDIRKKLLKNKL